MLSKEFLRAKRYDTKLSVMLLDIDDFKNINDNYGHLIGDEVLSEFSRLLKNNLRTTDTLGRWGGEEFIIIATETDINGAESIAEKLINTVQNYDFPKDLSITVSVGIGEFSEDMQDYEDLIRLSDRALYKAKSKGKNRYAVQNYTKS